MTSFINDILRREKLSNRRQKFIFFYFHDVVWCGVVWGGVVWCAVVWCVVVWCDVM
jgi:hypothetical protein